MSQTLPPHQFKLKICVLVIFLRNLDPSAGLCNGAPVHVVRYGQLIPGREILGIKHAMENWLVVFTMH